jgi:pyruvate kinase
VGTGEEVIFARGEFLCDAASRPLRLCSTYPRLVDEVRPGQRVLIDDGNVRLLVERVTSDEVFCRTSSGGTISSGKGINLPETMLSARAMGERDQALARWAVQQDLDFLALSFVVSAEEVRVLRALIADEAARLGKAAGFRVPIVAKIERPQAVEAIDEIAEAADAIMVARGDLGVETDFAEVPIVQMRLLNAAHAAGRPCIVATQMLQSMVDAPTPTRAEASDVATAIMAGTDAVMLSAETAVGRWPVAAVDAMRRIALASERWVARHGQRDRASEGMARTGYRTAALAHGAWHIVRDNRAVCVVIWSQAGGGARYLSQNEFSIPILAFSSDQRAVRQMSLLRSVWPVHAPKVPASLEAWRRDLDGWLLREGWARRGERVLLVAGEPLGVAGTTDALIVHEVVASA